MEGVIGIIVILNDSYKQKTLLPATVTIACIPLFPIIALIGVVAMIFKGAAGEGN
jgi:hypothetical protein